jgi:hypothetical protein
MVIHMSTLSQFLPAGDSFVGEMIPGPASIWGGNPTFSGKEYLRTGLLKTYTSNYSGIFSALPTACVAAGQKLFTNSNWLLGGNGSYGPWGTYLANANIYDLGGNKHVVYNSSTGQNAGITAAIKYGSSFASAPTNGMDLSGDGTYGSAIYSSIFWNNAIYVSNFRPLNTAAYTMISRSTGGAYSDVSGTNAPDYVFFAGSGSRLVAIQYTYMGTGDSGIRWTTNGTTWNAANPNTSLQYPQRFCWSQAGNCFIIVRNGGQIVTSPDGVTWTVRTPPANMPTGVAGGAEQPYCINTATATYIMLGAPTTSSTYILKTTDGVNFTLVDLADSSPLVGLFTGMGNNIAPYLLSDGTRMILFYGTNQAYSTNDGATWTIDTTRYQNVNTATATLSAPMVYSGGMYIPYVQQTQYGSFLTVDVISFAGRSFSATPQFVGATAAQVFASGSNLSTYFRIK